ncbi:hypothetical protein METBIDRAFT_145036 [Metschnikowia bicuspidata var. bicuspidata NRRL YB-4993]|uniref:Uncharacterized protein n=1 Tax=Metschnikowia bicuspidata var. bicuspidata NRRL YB-4993 TaxID=869754 RepID=A0A1A0HDM6_9ASCO|nr:hypothetical protein METBIDRAFT_145036 [Metschnikowia bicuspidata var. bicuspidata NRRL YB-4993]OBA22028.1 hypothetical protein METBIDRAFT_145036 [Metschnikowia bicuspidata var. bicuspidata NRRL YB-4993]
MRQSQFLYIMDLPNLADETANMAFAVTVWGWFWRTHAGLYAVSLRLAISSFNNFSSFISSTPSSCLFLHLASFIFLYLILSYFILPPSFSGLFFSFFPPLCLFPHLVSCLFSAPPGCLIIFNVLTVVAS